MSQGTAPNVRRIKGILRTNERVAAALGLSREHIGRILSGKYPEPGFAKSIAHLVEHTPPRHWPVEWLHMEDLGDSHEWVLHRFAASNPNGTVRHPHSLAPIEPVKASAPKPKPNSKRPRHWAQRFQPEFSDWMQGKPGARDLSGIVGYSREDLREHMARQFKGRMSWANYGVAVRENKGWVIEHIVPKRLFGPDQVAEAYALTNLRPYWARDNIRKGSQRTHLL